MTAVVRLGLCSNLVLCFPFQVYYVGAVQRVGQLSLEASVVQRTLTGRLSWLAACYRLQQEAQAVSL